MSPHPASLSCFLEIVKAGVLCEVDWGWWIHLLVACGRTDVLCRMDLCTRLHSLSAGFSREGGDREGGRAGGEGETPPAPVSHALSLCHVLPVRG